VQSWQLFSRLQKRGHTLYTPWNCPFPGARNIYKNIRDMQRFFAHIDILFTIVDGRFNFSVEKFTFFSHLFGVPSVWLVNAPIEESLVIPWYDTRRFPFHKQARMQLSRYVDTAICISQELRSLIGNTLKTVNVRVVPNGSDPLLFSPKNDERSALDTFSHVYKVIWAGGGNYPWQGLDIIVKAAATLRKHRDIVFIIVTDQSWVDIPLGENILCLRAVDYIHLSPIVAACDVCLCLYHNQFGENFYLSPMKLFDYMAMAKPVIASELGQIKTIIKNNQNGMLTNNNVDDIVSKIQFLKSHKNKAVAMGKQARTEILKYYNWDRVTRNIEELLIQCVEARKRN
jgi:glycosyltransferase involved in cell wall biosynthesis